MIDDNLRELMQKDYFGKSVPLPGGSTATSVFVSPQHIFVANVGDSRAVMCNKGVPILATQDHKPELPKEKKRILSAGGKLYVQTIWNNEQIFNLHELRSSSL